LCQRCRASVSAGHEEQQRKEGGLIHDAYCPSTTAELQYATAVVWAVLHVLNGGGPANLAAENTRVRIATHYAEAKSREASIFRASGHVTDVIFRTSFRGPRHSVNWS